MSAAPSEKLVYQAMFWQDYVAHPQLLVCSWAAQGAWPRILALCWDSEQRGYLLLNGKTPTLDQLAAIFGKPAETIPPLIAELEANGVFSRDERGVIFCRRMVSDEAKRQRTRAPKTIVNDAIEAVARDEEKRAKHRARQLAYRQRKRAQSALDGMRNFEAMAVAVARADGADPVMERDASRVTQSVTPASRVTSQGGVCDVTHSVSDQGGDAVFPSRVYILPLSTEPITSEPDASRQGPGRSLASLTGGERPVRADAEERGGQRSAAPGDAAATEPINIPRAQQADVARAFGSSLRARIEARSKSRRIA